MEVIVLVRLKRHSNKKRNLCCSMTLWFLYRQHPLNPLARWNWSTLVKAMTYHPTRCQTIIWTNADLLNPSELNSISPIWKKYNLIIKNVLEIIITIKYKANPIPKLKCFSSRLAVVFAQSIEDRYWVEHGDVVGAAPKYYIRGLRVVTMTFQNRIKDKLCTGTFWLEFT